MKKEILIYFLVFCFFGTVGVGVVNYFGPNQKAAKLEDSCVIEHEVKENHIVNPTNTSSESEICENEDSLLD